MQVAISNFGEMKVDNKLLIIGEMRELGAISEESHKNIVELMKKNNFPRVFLVGASFESIANNYTFTHSFPATDTLIEYLKANEILHAFILIKGSRGNNWKGLQNTYKTTAMNDRVVIIPTYNEKENIENILRYVFKLEPKFDVLVIEDNSPDGTAQIVKRLQSEFPQLHMIERKGKLGLGTAYITGFKWSLEHGYNYIFEMDADFSHNPDDLVKLYTPAKAGKAIWRSVPVTSQALTS